MTSLRSFPAQQFLPAILTSLLALSARGADNGDLLASPAQFDEVIRPRLITAETASSGHSTAKTGDADKTSLYNEDYLFLKDDGTLVSVENAAVRIETQSGVEDAAAQKFGFRPQHGSFFVVEAETISPDGTRTPVSREAIVRQTPQRLADEGIYSEKVEVVVHFPKAQPGSILRYIVAWEYPKTGRIPGELTQSVMLQYYHPVLRRRIVLSMPADWERRVNAVTLGAMPACHRSASPDGKRTDLVWEQNDVPARTYECYGERLWHTGPMVRLTSLKSWDDLAIWYTSLLDEAGGLPDELKQMSGAPSDAASPEETVQKLLAIVESRFRYLSLEFGDGGYQPQSPSAVWTNGFGDCKDKSNVLRLMLKQRGIPAYIALLNTEHSGRIPEDAPMPGVFDHAIVAVKLGERYVFCDPTLPESKAGELGSGSIGRRVLIIRDDEQKAEWVETPRNSAGRLDYTIQLELKSPAGPFGGWFELLCHGQFARNNRKYFAVQDPEDRGRRVRAEVERIFRDPYLIDHEITPTVGNDGAFKLRAYFLLPKFSPRQPDGTLTIPRPSFGSMLPDLEGKKAVKWRQYFWQDETTLNLEVNAGEGAVFTSMPDPIRIDTHALALSGAWVREGTAARLATKVEFRNPLVVQHEFPQFAQAVEAFEQWGDQTPVVSISEQQPPVADIPDSASPADVPLDLMPTVDGQLALVDRLYPSDGNKAARRAALQKVQQYFPRDQAGLFEVQIHLAILDLQEDKPAQAIERIRRARKDYGHSTPANTDAWARHIEAMSLFETNEGSQAEQILFEILAGHSSSQFRRTAAFSLLAQRSGDHVFDRLSDLRDSGLRPEEPTGLETEAYPAFAKAALDHNRAEDLAAELARLAKSENPDAADAIEAVVNRCAPEHRTVLLAALKKSGGAQPPALFAKAELDLNNLVEGEQAMAEIRSRVAELLASDAETKAALDGASIPAEWTQIADFENGSDSAEKSRKPAQLLRCRMERVARFPVDRSFPKAVWLVLTAAEYWQRLTAPSKNSALLGKLFAIGRRLPNTGGYLAECLFVEAEALARVGDRTAELAVLNELLALDLREEWWPSLYLQLGQNAEARLKFDEALGHYARIAHLPAVHERAVDGMFRAAAICAMRGDRDGAASKLAKLADLTDSQIENASNGEAIQQLRDICTAGLWPKFYDAQRRWWPAWMVLREKLLDPKPAAATPLGKMWQAISDTAARSEAATQPLPDNPRWLQPGVIGDSHEFGVSLGATAKTPNREDFARLMNRLAEACRIEPRRLIDFAETTPTLLSVAPSLGEETHSLVLAMLDSHTFSDPEMEKARQMRRAVALLETSRELEAIPLLDALADDPPRQNPHMADGVHRLMAIAAIRTGKGTDRAMQLLEADLKGNVTSRIQTVRWLSALYGAKKETARQTALLNGEKNHPDNLGNPASMAWLEDATTQIRAVEEDWSEGILRWLDHNAPAWLRSDLPPFIDEARLDAIANDDSWGLPEDVSGAEVCLALDRIIRNSKYSAEARLEALNDLVQRLLILIPESSESDALLDSALAIKGLPERALSMMTVQGAYSAALNRRSQRMKAFAERMTAFESLRMDASVLELLKCDLDSATQVAEATKAVARVAGGQQVLGWLRVGFERLLQLGAFDLADGVLTELKQADSTTSPYRRAMLDCQIDFSRSLSKAQALHPVHEKLRAMSLKTLEKLNPQRPSGRGRLDGLVDSAPNWELFQLYLWRISSRNYPSQYLGFWCEFADILSFENWGAPSFMLALFTHAVELAPDDRSKGNVIANMGDFVDPDDLAASEPFLRACARYNDPAKWPECTRVIRLRDLGRRLRQGGDITLAQVRQFMGAGRERTISAMHFLQFGLSRNRLADIESGLKELPSDVLLEPMMLDTSLRASMAAKDEGLLEILRPEAEAYVRRVKLDATASCDAGDALRAVEIAFALGKPELIDNPWIDSMLNRLRRQPSRSLFAIRSARLHSDWSRVILESRDFLDQCPSFYSAYGELGMALWEQGDRTAARPHLETYVQYCHDEPDWWFVAGLLEQKPDAQSSAGH